MSAKFELDCIDCEFETTVVGEFADAVEAVDEHRAAVEAAPADHFVNIQHRG